MRTIGLLCLASLLLASGTAAQGPEVYQPVGTMTELMVSMTYPAANDILLAASRPPQTDAEWMAVQRSAILLAESGNLLTMRGRAYDQGQWIKDARMMADAGAAAYRAARAKDMAALTAASEPMNTSCVSCHRQYRPNVHPRR